MIRVRTASAGDRHAWDEFLCAHDEAGPYQLSAWGEAISRAYGGRVYGLIAEAGGTIAGILPLARIKLPLMRGTLVSQPYCDYGGIIASESEAVPALLARAAELAATLKCRLELRCCHSMELLEDRQDISQVTGKSRMLLELPPASEVLWKKLKSKLRSQVRKPVKEGFEFELAGAEAVGSFFHIFSRNMRDLGSPAHSRKWFEEVVLGFGSRARVGLVKKDGVAVASGILLSCGETICNPWASSLREYRRFSPNMLLYWEFLKHACDEGFKRFDFGRSTPGEGSYRFKEQWGAVPEPLYWYVDRAPAAERSPGSGAARRLVERLWSRLPVTVATAAGARIRRYISL